MKTELIRCQADDVETLLSLAAQTFSDAFAAMNTPETMQAYLAEAFTREKFLDELSNPHSQFYFLLADGNLAGYIKLNDTDAQSDLQDPQALEIERIYVHRDFQGQGLGRALIEFALQKALEMGKSSAWLGVWQKNLSAIAFYQKMGFMIAGEHSFRMGEELQSDWVMKKSLI
jgi:ribosomal protein S18 acetylase RimI-like enzyme